MSKSLIYRADKTKCSWIPLLFFVILCLFSSCYYSKVGEWTKDDQIAAEHFFKSMRANKEYLRIVKSGDPFRKFTYEEKEELRQRIIIAANEARKALDHPEFLDKMHPDLRQHYKEEYLRSMELTLQNFDFPDYDTALTSDSLYNIYVQWYEDHQAEIKIPKGK